MLNRILCAGREDPNDLVLGSTRLFIAIPRKTIMRMRRIRYI